MQINKTMKTPKKIMDAAKGEECLLVTPYCNYERETVVACHLPDGTGGSNRLTGPLSISFGCSGCHDAIDDRITVTHEFREEREFYLRRGQNRTLNRLIDKGLVKF